MALQHTGRDLALRRDPLTGKFDLVISSAGPNRGNPVLDDSRTHAVLTNLMSRKRGSRLGSQPQGGYYYDPTGSRGSLIWTIGQDKLSTPSQLRAYGEDVGARLVDAKQIRSYRVSASRVGAGKFRLDFAWTLLDGSSVSPVSVGV